MIDLQVSSLVARLTQIQHELVALTAACSGTGSGQHISDVYDNATLYVHKAREMLMAAVKPSGVPENLERTTCPYCGFPKNSAWCQAQHP